LWSFLEDYIQKGPSSKYLYDISAMASQGPALELFAKIFGQVSGTTSDSHGGVSSITDLMTRKPRPAAVIYGKALYEGRIN
jgi:phosphoribosylformimino-5-aminoimidazole carboxamide ribonucleotide (ProFAR) isomerase